MSEQIVDENRKRGRDENDEQMDQVMDVEPVQQYPDSDELSKRPIAGQRRQHNSDFHQNQKRRNQPRVKTVSPIIELCRQMLPDICTLGEKKDFLSEDLELIGQGICANFYIDQETDGKFKNSVLTTIIAVAIEQPQKRHALALLILKVIGISHVVGKEILETFLMKFKTSLEEQNWNNVKNILGFLACINSALPKEFLLENFKNLFKLSFDLKEQGKSLTADMIFFNTCAMIPQLFVFKRSNDHSLLASVVEILQELSDKVEFDENNNSLVNFVLPAVKKFIDNDFEDLKNFYTNYEKDVTILKAENLNLNIDPSLYEIVYPSVESINDIGSLSREEAKNPKDFLWSIKRQAFTLFEPILVEQENEEPKQIFTTADKKSYESLIFNDTVSDILLALEFNKMTAISTMLSFHSFFNESFFFEKNASIKSLTEAFLQNPAGNYFKIEDMQIEAILQLVFDLYPNDALLKTDKTYYFYYVLVGICFDEPSVAPVYGRAFTTLFDRLSSNEFDVDFKKKFVNWFNLQLRSFDFFWKWNAWFEDIKNLGHLKYNGKMHFLKDAINKNLRVTNDPELVASSLSEEYIGFILNANTTKETDEEKVAYYNSLFTQPLLEVSDLKSEEDGYFILSNKKLPFYEAIEKIIDFFRGSGSDENNESNLNFLIEVLGNLETEHGSLIANFDQFIITVMIQAVLHAGSRSISHLQNTLSHHHDNLINLYGAVGENSDINQWIMAAIYKYWGQNVKNVFLIFEIFYKNKLILNKSMIIDFLFKEKCCEPILYDTVYYDFLVNLLHKVSVEENDIDLVLRTFSYLTDIMNDCTKTLNISGDVPLPNVQELENNATNDEGLEKLETYNKLRFAVNLGKTLLRKFHRVFVSGGNIFSSIMDSKAIERELSSYHRSL